jgi:hypothetical protein
MPTQEIEEFARMLVQKVRDIAIQSSDRRMRSDSRSPVANRWKEAAKTATPDTLAETLIPDIVDDTIFYLLQAIDQELLPLTFMASNGKSVDLPKEGLGELSGWYMGSPGWRAMFAKERFNDDVSDLADGI